MTVTWEIRRISQADFFAAALYLKAVNLSTGALLGFGFFLLFLWLFKCEYIGFLCFFLFLWLVENGWNRGQNLQNGIKFFVDHSEVVFVVFCRSWCRGAGATSVRFHKTLSAVDRFFARWSKGYFAIIAAGITHGFIQTLFAKRWAARISIAKAHGRRAFLSLKAIAAEHRLATVWFKWDLARLSAFVASGLVHHGSISVSASRGTLPWLLCTEFACAFPSAGSTGPVITLKIFHKKMFWLVNCTSIRFFSKLSNGWAVLSQFYSKAPGFEGFQRNNAQTSTMAGGLEFRL